VQDRRYPPLPEKLVQPLSAVEATDGLYRPCMVTLHDGSTLDCVYLVEAQPWFSVWGVWPEDDEAKLSVDVRAVAAIEDSPSRLPASVANALYAAGESGMGYTIFTVQFVDESSVTVVTGNAIDFIDYPRGQSKETVVNALPHVGRDDPQICNGPRYHWCLYDSAGETG